MTKNEKIQFINGILYGIKTSIKLIARLKDIQKSINVLCLLQDKLVNIDNIDNINIEKIWSICEKETIKKYKY